MSGLGGGFDPAELRDLDGPPIDEAEAAAMLEVARDLEAFAATQVEPPSVGFEDRVMAAIASEPTPVVAAGFLAGLVLAFREAWRTAWSVDRPMSARGRSLAFVVLSMILVASTGLVAAVGVSQLLDRDPTTAPSPDPSLTVPTPSLAPPSGPTPLASPTLSPSPGTTPSPSPSPTPRPTETEEPGETAEATDDHGGGGGTPRPTSSPKPAKTPHPSDTPEPDDTPHPDDTPDPDETPSPSPSPKPTSTP
jgi:hypothetical protein